MCHDWFLQDMEASYETPEDCESSCALPSRIMVSYNLPGLWVVMLHRTCLPCMIADFCPGHARWRCLPVYTCHATVCMTRISAFLGAMHGRACG